MARHRPLLESHMHRESWLQGLSLPYWIPHAVTQVLRPVELSSWQRAVARQSDGPKRAQALTHWRLKYVHPSLALQDDSVGIVPQSGPQDPRAASHMHPLMAAQLGWVVAAYWHFLTHRELTVLHVHSCEFPSQLAFAWRVEQASVQAPEAGLTSQLESARHVSAVIPYLLKHDRSQ